MFGHVNIQLSLLLPAINAFNGGGLAELGTRDRRLVMAFVLLLIKGQRECGGC